MLFTPHSALFRSLTPVCFDRLLAGGYESTDDASISRCKCSNYSVDPYEIGPPLFTLVWPGPRRRRLDYGATSPSLSSRPWATWARWASSPARLLIYFYELEQDADSPCFATAATGAVAATAPRTSPEALSDVTHSPLSLSRFQSASIAMQTHRNKCVAFSAAVAKILHILTHNWSQGSQ